MAEEGLIPSWAGENCGRRLPGLLESRGRVLCARPGADLAPGPTTRAAERGPGVVLLGRVRPLGAQMACGGAMRVWS